MALTPSEQHQFDNEVALKMKHHEINFKNHKDALQIIFDEVQSLIDNSDLDPTWVTEFETKKAQGKTLLLDMLNNITTV
jgi:hypothetical protein